MKKNLLLYLVQFFRVVFRYAKARHDATCVEREMTLIGRTMLIAMSLVIMNRSIAESVQPNIVLVMADDQGWGDTGYNGHPELKTPNLDAMAESGLRLNRFYTAHFNCSPTRASVMTGRHPHRMGTFGPGSPIRAQELTVAKVLQNAGYATGHFGKWHLNGKNGDRDTKTSPGRAILVDDPLSPGKLGFDEWISADNFFDLDPVLGRNGVAEKFQGDGSDISMDEALKFIRKQSGAGQPFFAVVWFGNPHTPHEALPSDKALYASLPEKDQEYYGELTGIDRNVGKLRAALRELQVSNNTLLWYCSDNGGANGPKSTGDLRGSKGTLWEGGVRVPGIVEWPARIATPFASDLPCSTLDIYPTVLAATNADVPKQVQPLDGIDLNPLFDRRMDARGKAIAFWADARRPTAHATLMDWPYKLHTQAIERKDKQNRRNLPASPTLLYDVSKDPNETTDLASQHPERVAKMTAALDSWKASVEKSLAGNDYEVPLIEQVPAKMKLKKK
jgi:arylsulfatase A-like enzyme